MTERMISDEQVQAPRLTCPCCGRWTQEGLTAFAKKARDNPISKIDLTRPISEIIAGLRSEIADIRGKFQDIGFGFPRWEADMKMIHGLLTCGLISLHWVMDEAKKDERERAAEALQPPPS